MVVSRSEKAICNSCADLLAKMYNGLMIPIKAICSAAMAILLLSSASGADKSPVAAVVSFSGADFKGGGKDLYGSAIDGRSVNYVYAQPTGKRAEMESSFTLAAAPREPMFLYVTGRDDDSPRKCVIAIELNGKILFEGSNAFPKDKFTRLEFAIPENILTEGENVISIINREEHGGVGMPPWFQVAACDVGAENCFSKSDLHKEFKVVLPVHKRPFPEPLPAGKSPGFKWRGIKAWMWKPNQYFEEIPVLPRYKMNFFMNCYGNMCDIEHFSWGDPNCNRWWEPLPPEKKECFEKIVHQCQAEQITFCFSMNPNLSSRRIVNDDNPQSIDELYQHYAWMQNLGVKWFNISLDDISAGINASKQAKVVNEIFGRLRAKDPEAQMIFCPTFYWGDGKLTNSGVSQQAYLETLAKKLNPDVYMFWTGDGVIGKVTLAAAKSFRYLCGHRLFLWDNYPVNDNTPTMHLGPVVDRDPRLCEVIDGYLSNSMCKQNELNRLPLATCADYAYNPWDYDPMRSIGQAILLWTHSSAQRAVLAQLVDAYPGFLLYNAPGGTGSNPVLDRFQRINDGPQPGFTSRVYIDGLRKLSEQMRREFPDRYAAGKETLNNDIQKLQNVYANRYPAENKTFGN